MFALVLTALIWGFAFVAQVQGMDSMSPLFFNACRFTLGALSLVPILIWQRGQKARGRQGGDTTESVAAQSAAALDNSHGRQGATSFWRSLLANPVVISVLCGIILFTASTLQQYGILYGKSAGRAGFLTALYIVMVPLLAFVFLHRRIGLPVFVAVTMSIIGFYFLCITDGFGSIGLADILLVFTAALFAAHILVIDELGAKVDAIVLSFGQFCTTAVLSWVGSLMEGSVNWTGALHAWTPIVYAGIGSVGIAYTLQVVGQQWVPPTRASLLMSLESFFSAVGGAIFLGEIMTPRGYLGCALIFFGTLLAQAPAKLPKFLRKE
ncbi:DMT family transporter [Bifidobacterium felsineum]|uniref:EamA family transporter n=1 Tax=Bifidobacterium felsineum TaxID=2045440 RepID=A0A2M9HJW1_9BIFI|nr:DMT family transporter [Bifidobacterium felsineum]MBT1164094.1 DMT family transporter [Bifidobacterium felsineum]PJM77095.1 EamA family transporter [Bifidobacterium felsineum]